MALSEDLKDTLELLSCKGESKKSLKRLGEEIASHHRGYKSQTNKQIGKFASVPDNHSNNKYHP